jgi:hypothetical protein
MDYYTQLIIKRSSEKNKYEKILNKIRNEEEISEKDKKLIENYNEKIFEEKVPYRICKFDSIDFFMNIIKKGEHTL